MIHFCRQTYSDAIDLYNLFSFIIKCALILLEGFDLQGPSQDPRSGKCLAGVLLDWKEDIMEILRNGQRAV